MRSLASKPSIILILAMVLNPGGLLADSLLLKDGTEITGNIITDGPDSVLVEYFVTPTIKEQKTFPRDRIVKMVKITKDEKGFLDMGGRATPPTVLDTSFYDPLVEKKIPDFIKEFPYSRHVSELREDLRSMTAERERVSHGDRRIDGVWFTASQIAEDPYQTGAKIRFYVIRQLLPNDDPVGVLKAYELFEKEFPGCGTLPDALDLACNQFPLLQGKISSAKANFGILDKQRQMNLLVVRADEAKEIKDAIEKENLSVKASIANAAKDGSKFFPIFPNNQEALDALQALLTAEKARMLLLQAMPMRESLGASKEAVRLIQEEKYKQAQEKLDAAAKLWPANADVATLRKQIESLTKPVKSSSSPILPRPSNP